MQHRDPLRITLDLLLATLARVLRSMAPPAAAAPGKGLDRRLGVRLLDDPIDEPDRGPRQKTKTRIRLF